MLKVVKIPDFEIKELSERIAELDDMETSELDDLRLETLDDIKHAKDFLRRSLGFLENELKIETLKGGRVPHDPLEAVEYFASDVRGKAEWLEENAELLREIVARLEGRDDY